MVKLPWFFALAYIFCLPAALLAQGIPTYSATDENGKLTLTREPCKQHVWLNKWRVARWNYKGKDYEACYRVNKDDSGEIHITVLDSDGDVSSIPWDAFKRDE